MGEGPEGVKNFLPRWWCGLLLGLLLFASQRASAVTALFDTDGGLFDAPFPSAKWSRPDGGLALPPLPKKADKDLKDLWKGFETDNQGFSVAPMVVFPLSGALDEKKLPAHPRETILRTAPLFLMAIQPGARDYGLLYPLTVQQVVAGKGEKAKSYLLLQPMPGVTLEPGAWYAAVLTTGLKDKKGEALKADMPFLSVFANTRRAGAVGRNVFWPEPKVESGLVRIERTDDHSTDPVVRQQVFAAIDAAFAQRRKTMRSALAGWAGSAAEAERRLREAGIDPGVRGEKLDVDDFVRLARTT